MQKEQEQCLTCGENIPKANYSIHQLRCNFKKQSKLRQQKSRLSESKLGRQKPKGILRVGKKKIFPEQNQTWRNQQEKIPCSFCGYMQSLTELDTHPGRCEGRQDICQHCGEMYPNQLMRQHEEVCPEMQHSNYSYESSQQQKQEYDNQGYISSSRIQDLQIDRLMNLINLIDDVRNIFSGLQVQQGEQALNKQKQQKLKKFKYKLSKQDELCTICYCKLQTGEQCMELKCKHIYHTECIMKWFEQSAKCPVCKHDQNLDKK